MKGFLSDKAADYAAQKYQQRLPFLKERTAEVSGMVEKLTGDERILMEFLYGTMPLSDAVRYEPELFYSYVKHGCFLRKNYPWTGALSEEMFLDYVLCHRVNNEAITDCRGWFYEMLRPVVEGRSLEEAIREVNYWCASQASYAASDQRTLSPAAVFRSGSGRCGEESTFLVTALRSVGIAARQVYAPRWAHCDDNHAWVEAWVDEGWHFLGACEPEEVLDKGWFTNASSRAMLIHTRVFSDLFLMEDQEETEITGRDGAAFLINRTSSYAKTSPLTVLVKDRTGNPVPGARVSFTLLNMAEYAVIARLDTDKEGKAVLTLGLGSVRICVTRGEQSAELWVENGKENIVEAILSEQKREGEGQNLRTEQQAREDEGPKVQQETGWQYFDHKAPRDFPMHPVRLTKEQKLRGRARKQEADQQRREKLAEFDRQAERLAEELLKRGADSGSLSAQSDGASVIRILKAARGNAPEIFGFLKKHPEKEALEFLSVLAPKDYRDIRQELLEEHFTCGQQMRAFCLREYLNEEEHPEELYLQYVWNPRIGYEEITPYRSFLGELLADENKKIFRREPQKIWEWIQSGIPTITLCEEKEKRILFVAVCRTLGIPARLHPTTGEAEYFKEHQFHNPVCPEKEEKQVRMILTSQEEPEYFASWTIGRRIDGTEGEKRLTGEEDSDQFETLDLTGKKFVEGSLTLLLPEGVYRLITTVRLPDGNQLEARRTLDTKNFLPGEDGQKQCILPLHFRKPEISQMLEELALESFSLQKPEGGVASDREVLGEGHTLLAFLEEGAEPTEHLLNELLEKRQEVTESGLKVVFVVTGEEALKHPTLDRAVRVLGAQMYYDDFRELPELLARRMYTDPEKLPLVLLISPGRMGRYASSGYNVGSVGLLLRIAGIVQK